MTHPFGATRLPNAGGHQHTAVHAKPAQTWHARSLRLRRAWMALAVSAQAMAIHARALDVPNAAGNCTPLRWQDSNGRDVLRQCVPAGQPIALNLEPGQSLWLDCDSSEDVRAWSLGASNCSTALSAWCVRGPYDGHVLSIRLDQVLASPAPKTTWLLLRGATRSQLFWLTPRAPMPALAVARWLQIHHPSAQREWPLLRQGMGLFPAVHNAHYRLATSAHAESLQPDLVFDDGRFTYVHFPAHADLGAAFAWLDDGSLSKVGLHMQADYLVLEAVRPRWLLQSGAARVGIWNDAFDVRELNAHDLPSP